MNDASDDSDDQEQNDQLEPQGLEDEGSSAEAPRRGRKPSLDDGRWSNDLHSSLDMIHEARQRAATARAQALVASERARVAASRAFAARDWLTDYVAGERKTDPKK